MTGKVIDFNSRSVGDVPAIDDACLEKYDALEGVDSDELAVKLATSVERNATLKLLKQLGGETNNIVARKWLKKAREIIEKGEHL